MTISRLVVQLSWACAASARLVLPDVAPRGFNSFDHYRGEVLNHTSVLEIADSLQSQLLPHGYEYLVIDGGWTTTSKRQHLDQWGRPVFAPDRYPHGMKKLADEVHARGLKFGLWTIRGVHVDAVAMKSPVKGMPQYTMDQLVDTQNVGGGANGSCLWAHEWLGVNMSHPAAQAYYDSRVELLVEYGVDFIKADCMMCGPCYTDEVMAFTKAVRGADRDLVLSYSPGGGNSVSDGRWVAGQAVAPNGGPGVLGESTEPLGSMYRIVTDFHGGWYGWGSLQQSLFIQGNFSAGGLYGANNTWPDPDMLPLSRDWWGQSQERDDRGQTIATMWMISRAPLMHAGEVPLDDVTLKYLTNPVALRVHAEAAHSRNVGYEGNCTCKGGPTSCTIPKDYFPEAPCIAKWAADLDGGGTIVAAVVNMGENTTMVNVRLADFMHHGDTASPSYRVEDVWTGGALGTYNAESPFALELRPHASMLLSCELVRFDV